MSPSDSEVPAGPTSPAAPAAPAGNPVGTANSPAGAGSAIATGGASASTATPRPRVHWFRAFLIAVPIGAAMLGWWYYTHRSASAHEQSEIAVAQRLERSFPTQPERAYGDWRGLMENNHSSSSLKNRAHDEIQRLIDSKHLTDRYDDLVATNLRAGESGLPAAERCAQELIYLDTHFHTAEKPEQGQVRLQHLTAIDAGFADAMNDKTERAQYEKAIEKLTALYKQYPEAEFIRPVIASLNVEMAEALIDLDKLEDAVEQFRDAYKANPLPQYRDRLVGLQADIKRLDPSKDIAEAQAAEKACQWDDAQADYAHALELRPSNKEARAGYTRILKFYAQVFLDNAQSKDGELTPQGAKFVKLAEKNGKQIAQYGDPELVLARAELILAESEFASDNQEKAKSDVDEALGSIAKEYRRTKDGAYLMARIFKLYYHLARYLNKQTEGRESLALADQYCRLALDQKNPKAAALFVQLQELERIEQQSSDAAKSAGETEPFAVNRAGDPRNLVNEGPLSKGAPLDSIAAQNAADRPPVGLPASPPGENSLDAPASKAPASGTSTAPENTTPATPTTPANSPAGDGLTKDQLLHPLH